MTRGAEILLEPPLVWMHASRRRLIFSFLPVKRRWCTRCTLMPYPTTRSLPVENIFSIFEGGSAFLASGLGPYPVGQVQYDRGAGHFSIQFPVHARMHALVIMQIVSVLNLGAALVG
jgi:hypothetical protein